MEWSADERDTRHRDGLVDPLGVGDRVVDLDVTVDVIAEAIAAHLADSLTGLRRSFATAAISARVPVEVVAAQLGNTSRVTQEVLRPRPPADDTGAAQAVGPLPG